MSIVNTNGYDGVELDWEASWTISGATTLISALRTALGSKLLTFDAGGDQSASWNGTNTASLDRLNLMTYGFAYAGSAYPWFNSPLYGTPDVVWYTDIIRTRFEANGVPAGKMNMGIGFYGMIYQGGSPVITGPRQSYGGTLPSVSEIEWYQIIASYNVSNPTRDAASGGAPWIAVANGWLTFEDPTYIAAEVQYAISKGLGGFFCWNLEIDYISAGSTPAQKHPLLSATGGTQ
jgi:chitinase